VAISGQPDPDEIQSRKKIVATFLDRTNIRTATVLQCMSTSLSGSHKTASVFLLSFEPADGMTIPPRQQGPVSINK